jgi:prepilin-type N-terminal cleavage/methylation domain-containing protein
MKSRKSDIVRSGFTLIEMLVVILIIMMLSAMLFKIAGLVTGKTARAKSVADIANIENALAEFYSEYNIYPPTSQNSYIFEDRSSHDAGFQNVLDKNNDPGSSRFITDGDVRYDPKNPDRQWGQSTKGSLGCEYGLVSYLWPRDQGQGRWVKNKKGTHWYDQDTEHDIAAKTKWNHFLTGLNLKLGKKEMEREIGGTVAIYTNKVLTVVDPWNNGYEYRCKPPYMKYKLWSVGPDGSSGTADDINNDTFNE